MIKFFKNPFQFMSDDKETEITDKTNIQLNRERKGDLKIVEKICSNSALDFHTHK